MIGTRRVALLQGPAKLPAFLLDVDFTTSSGSSRFSCTRAQTTADLGTDLVSSDASGATIGHFAANTLRQKNGKGLLVEVARANRFLNSEVPVTQTITLSTTGTWILWVNGSGTAAVSAGTATGTGFGTASQGTPVIFSITVAGTVVVTVTGTLFAVNLETGAWVSSFVKVTTIALTRSADVVTLTDPTLFSMSEGTALFEWEDLLGNNATTSIMFQGYLSSGNTITLQKTSAGLVQFIIATGAVTQASLVSANACVAGTIYRAAVSWKLNNVLAYYTASLNSGQLSDTVATMPGGVTASVNLGTSQGNTAPFNNRIRRVAFAPKASKAAVLRQWAQAA